MDGMFPNVIVFVFNFNHDKIGCPFTGCKDKKVTVL